MDSRALLPSTMGIQKPHISATQEPRRTIEPKTLPMIEDDKVDLRPIDRALEKGFPDIYWGPGTRIQRPTARSPSTVQESALIDMSLGWKGKGKATDTDIYPSLKIGLSVGFERYWQDISNDEVITLLHDSGMIRTVKERIERDFYHHRLIYYKAMDWTTCGMKEAEEDWKVILEDGVRKQIGCSDIDEKLWYGGRGEEICLEEIFRWRVIGGVGMMVLR
ncbi:hypothetical protein DID88_007934 [Monilinia fructigena]|uniref:Uncharacterized protein n=1 Tax=Monilinia fructigena TaxID=38457 RepID=A0A395J4E8_9HELO|nr:hypothetical protein DID88_007934 [Monilinia fructigena]